MRLLYQLKKYSIHCQLNYEVTCEKCVQPIGSQHGLHQRVLRKAKKKEKEDSLVVNVPALANNSTQTHHIQRGSVAHVTDNFCLFSS